MLGDKEDGASVNGAAGCIRGGLVNATPTHKHIHTYSQTHTHTHSLTQTRMQVYKAQSESEKFEHNAAV